MGFERDEALRRQAEELDVQAREVARQRAENAADELWQAGDRGGAMVRLHNSGWDDADMVRFGQARGLSEADVRRVIRDAPIDWS